MNFPIPHKSENPVCAECLTATPEQHNECDGPCHHLVSFASHEARAAVARAAAESANTIKVRWDKPPFEPVGGD